MAWPLTYLDFLAVTRTNKKTAVNQFINEALVQSYLLGLLIDGRGLDEITQGGTSIVDFIQYRTNSSSAFYAPGDQQTPVATDTVQQISLPWRFLSSNYAWENEERALNEADVDKFIRVKDLYESGCLTDQIQKTEDSFWAVPSTTDMEASAGRIPYSIPCFINEYTNTVPTGFTTVMGTNPATITQWQNQRVGYTVSNLTNPTSSTGLLKALRNMSEKVRFRPVAFGKAKGATHQEADNVASKLVIVTGSDGIDQYQNCLYATNDRTASPSDAGNMDYTYRGHKMSYVTAVDTAAIYSGGLSGTHSSGVAATGAPRFYFINGEYIKPIFNSNRFMDEDEPIRGGQNRPNSYVQYYWTQQNLWCSSRKRQGIVYPSAL